MRNQLLLLSLCLISTISCIAQDSVEKATIKFLFEGFNMVWTPDEGQGYMYFNSDEYEHYIDLGYVYYDRAELDVLHKKIIECLDYTSDASKTNSATWNLPDGASIMSMKDYNWSWLSVDEGQYRYWYDRPGKDAREKINEGFIKWKLMID